MSSKIDSSHSPDAEDDGFVEEAQLCACHTENAEGQNKEPHAGPETEQREKEGAGRCKQPQKSQQHRTAAQTDPAHCRGESRRTAADGIEG